MIVDENDITYCRKVVFAFIVLLITIVAVYSNTLHSSWHFDDFPNINDNPLVHMTRLSWGSIKNALFSDRNNPNFPYRPVACLSFAFNYYFAGLNVFWYHVVNIFIHFLCSFYLFLFLHRTLTLPTLKEKYHSDAYFISLMATLLWAINPVQTQAITYIVQRMASMAALFYIMSMYYYLKGRTSQQPWKKTLHFGLCGLFFVLGLTTKENAAMLPISLFLYEVLILQENPAKFLKSNWTTIAATIGFTLSVGIVYFLWKNGGLPHLSSWYENRPFTLGQRLLTEPRIIFFYLSLLFYPMPYRLNITHDFNISTSFLNPPTTALALAGILALTVLGIMLAKKRRLISFSILFFLLNHTIESSIFPLELIFEHRNYLPSLFIFLPVALGFATLVKYYTDKAFMRFVLCGFVVLVIVGLGHSSFMRNFVWRNELSLWLDAVDKAPDLFRTHHNLGNIYQQLGKINQAKAEYELALEKKTLYNKNAQFTTYYNLGKLAFDRKEYEKAISYYQRSIKLNPRFPDNYVNLAAAFDAKGQHDKAYRYLKKAYNLDPFLGATNYNLGLYFIKEGKPALAVKYLKRALGDPGLNVIAQQTLAVAYKNERLLGLAAVNLMNVIAKNPNNISARFHLAEIYYRANMIDKAQHQVLQVIKAIDNERQFKQILSKVFDVDKGRRALAPDRHICKKLILTVLKEREKKLHEWQKYLP